jgi:hypothetical protein
MYQIERWDSKSFNSASKVGTQTVQMVLGNEHVCASLQ